MFQGDVYGCGEEGWRHDESADLDLETSIAPRILVQEDAADVAKAFQQACQCNESRVSPGLVSPS